MSKQRTKRVKAWAVINGENIVGDIYWNTEYVLGAATFNKKRAMDYVRESNEIWEENKKVIPVIITYSLPKTKKKK